MPLTGLTDSEIADLEAKLLLHVPTSKAVGNTTLRNTLGWQDKRYWAIRNRLIERGELERGRGKGGSVRQIEKPEDTLPATDPLPPPFVQYSEKDLYLPMSQIIERNWALDYDLNEVIVEVTAQGGSRPDGKWSRPDITLAAYKTYPYVPGRHYDVVTFEIKPSDGIDITVVYEALAHRRSATRAYALLHVPTDQKEVLEPLVEAIRTEAERHGIGVIEAADPSNYDTWEVLVEAVRHEPDPQRLNDFLAKQLSQRFREKFMTWFR